MLHCTGQTHSAHLREISLSALAFLSKWGRIVVVIIILILIIIIIIILITSYIDNNNDNSETMIILYLHTI